MKSAVSILCPKPFAQQPRRATMVASRETVWGRGRVTYVEGVDDR
jgi:hypothetical protein